jgi:DNA-binding NtrC family response regulator
MRPVLVVDDDPGTRDSFSAILKLEGIPAVSASTAEEGLATAGQLDLGLILADLRLPKRTGIDLLYEVSGYHVADCW